MQVADLMETEIITTTPDTTLMEIDELFTVHGISGAPVLDGGQLVGVISQSDVVRVLYDEQLAASEVSQYFMSPYPIPMPSINALARERAKIVDHLLEKRVGDVMTVVPVVVGPGDSVRDAAAKMLDARIHRVLVTSDHDLVGVLSAMDLVGLVATDL